MIALPARPNILKHFNTSIYDDVGALVQVGTPTISATKQRFASKNSLYITTGNGVQFTTDDNFNLGTKDFTISWSEYLVVGTATGASLTVSSMSSYPGILFGYNNSVDGSRYLYLSSNGTSWDIANAIPLGTTASCLNVWVDWEFSRKGNTFYVFKNGVLIQTFTSSLAIYYNQNSFTYLGAYVNVAWIASIYVCEFLVLKGTCLHTATFTPNTEEYTIPTTNFSGIVLTNRDIGLRTDAHQGYYIKSLTQSGTRSLNKQQGKYIYCFEEVGTRPQIIRVGTLANCFENYGGKPQNFRQGAFANGGSNVVKNSVVKNCSLIKHKNVWRLKQPLQVSKAVQNAGEITKLSLLGSMSKAANVDKVVNPKPIIINKFNYGGREKSLIGFDVNTFQVDSNVGYIFDVLVTTTHQYKTQQINISLDATQIFNGKWGFSAGDTVLIPLSDSQILNNITFAVDVSKLAIGVNYCKVNIVYDDGKTDFIPLTLTKEKFKRTQVERTLNSYDGGYSISGDYFKGRLVLPLPYADCPGAVSTYSNCKVLTTDLTNIDLDKYVGMVGIKVVGDGCRILVSFDNRITWYTFDGSIWSLVDSANIAINGMSVNAINAITPAQWATIFQPTKLDIMVYIDATKSRTPSPMLNSIGSIVKSANGDFPFSVPAGTVLHSMAYTIAEITGGDGSVWGGGYTYLFARINGGSDTQIDVVHGSATGYGSQHSETHTSTYTVQPGSYVDSMHVNLSFGGTTYGSANVNLIGSPAIAYCGGIRVTLSANLPPTIKDVSLSPSIVHKETSLLAGSITDSEGDTVQYKVTVNGNPVVPWTSFVQTPVEISVPISYTTETVGTNTVRIEAYDGDKYATYDTYITQTNNNPYIAGILNGLYLSATAGDVDNDTIKYRILFNGIVKADWTNFMPSPVSLNYKINRREVKLGQQNSLVVEAMDDLGSTGSCTFDFIGVDNKKRYAFIT